MVNNGRVTPYDGYPNGKSNVLVDEVLTSDIDMSGFRVSSRTPDLNKTYVPEIKDFVYFFLFDAYFSIFIRFINSSCLIYII